MNGLARLWTGTSPARPWPSYSQTRPISPLLLRPNEFTRLKSTIWARTARVPANGGRVRLPVQPVAALHAEAVPSKVVVSARRADAAARRGPLEPPPLLPAGAAGRPP